MITKCIQCILSFCIVTLSCDANNRKDINLLFGSKIYTEMMFVGRPTFNLLREGHSLLRTKCEGRLFLASRNEDNVQLRTWLYNVV